VGNEDHRRAALLEAAEDAGLDLDFEAGGGLVEDEIDA
jgi:hypothetical protein